MESEFGSRGWSVAYFLLALQLLICASAADDHGVTFLYPNATTQPNLTLYYLDTVNVSYISPFKTPLLYTFCNSGKSLVRTQDAAPYNGSTFVYLNFSSTTPCYFDLRPDTEAGHGRNSDSFTLSPDVRSQTTVGLPQPSSTSTSVSSSSSATSSGASSSSTATSSAADSNNSGLSAGAKAGIGVGVAIGVLGLAFVLGFLVLRRGRRQRGGVGITGSTYEKDGNDVKVHNQGGLDPHNIGHQHSGTSPLSEVEGSKPWLASELSGVALSPQEMEAERSRHELPG